MQAPQEEHDTETSHENLINPETLKLNSLGINYVRSLMAIVVGIVAGIAGFTGYKGFLFYIIMHFLTSALLLFKMKFDTNEYLTPHITPLWFAQDGLTSQGLSFVMFWTLSFAVIHIF